ncbi:MAG: phosphate/phosphite/phosphonate ABC transporter substrate-binding protein [Gammaproteobacteria bacterium]|nr:phosphate/phosphite/phosphonate ABC transporter substrate-binding protein [Gammaproteobacteria bacterium]
MLSRIPALLILLALTVSAELQARDYKVAVRAHHGIESAFAAWQATVDELNKNIVEHTFTLVPIVSLPEITEKGGQGQFDFVLTNPSSFVELEQLYQARALLTLNNKRANTSQTRFGSVIFTHALNKDILKIDDLAGKKLMAVSESAFGGWRVAWLELLEQGFDPLHELGELSFGVTKTQTEVVFSVLKQKVDAGVVRTDQLERMEAAGKIDMRYLRIINNKDIKGFPFFLSTKLFPEWCFAAMKEIPDKVSDQVVKTLLAIKPDQGAARSGKYTGWVKALDYTPVRELLRDLKVEPYHTQ